MTTMKTQIWGQNVDLGKTIPFSMLTPEQQRLRILGFPGQTAPITTEPMVTGVYYPSPGEYDELRKKTAREPVSIAVVKTENGDTVKVATDENGEVIATKKEPNNILPLAVAAGLAYMFLF